MTKDYLVAVVDLRALCPPASAKRLTPEQKKEKPDWAKTVLERMKDDDYDYFCPFTKKDCYRPATRHRPGFVEAVSVPVLHHYVPVRLPEGRTVRDLLGIRGVRFLLTVGIGDQIYFLRIPADEMAEFKWEYRRFLAAQKKEEFPIKPGTEVRLIGGKFIGNQAIFKEVDLIRRRCNYALEAMGQELKVEGPLTDVVNFEM